MNKGIKLVFAVGLMALSQAYVAEVRAMNGVNKENAQENCSICQQTLPPCNLFSMEYEERIMALVCGHRAHLMCLNHLNRSEAAGEAGDKCPLCRAKLEYVSGKALLEAVRNSQVKLVESELLKGVSTRDSDTGESAFLEALKKENEEIIKLFLRNGNKEDLSRRQGPNKETAKRLIQSTPSLSWVKEKLKAQGIEV